MVEEMQRFTNDMNESKVELNAIKKANQDVKEAIGKLKSSRDNVETIWLDIKNYDVDKLKDSWTAKNESETYRTKLLETEVYVKSILTKLDGFISVLKGINNELEERIGRSNEYVSYLRDRIADVEVIQHESRD